MVSEIINHEFNELCKQSRFFKGNIVSLIYNQFSKPVNGIHGIISLNLNYGEIMEEMVRLFLKNVNCKYVFTGGAGGYISTNTHDQKPDIGSRIAIKTSMNDQGEIVKLSEINTPFNPDKIASAMHLHIPSIFLETYDWLEKARKRGTSVDVETFYIIRAIQNHNIKNPCAIVYADCGYFVSDYVGEQALREYSKVFQNYTDILSLFLQNILSLS